MGGVRHWATGSAQKVAVAALDELQAIARQANGDFAQCVSGPRGGINFMAGEQRLGDRAILHAGETSVDNPQHLRDTMAARSDERRVRKGWVRTRRYRWSPYH